MVKRMRRQATDWEKMCAKDISDKGTVVQNLKRSLNFQKQEK
jgi:hypothetical protein